MSQNPWFLRMDFMKEVLGYLSSMHTLQCHIDCFGHNHTKTLSSFRDMYLSALILDISACHYIKRGGGGGREGKPTRTMATQTKMLIKFNLPMFRKCYSVIKEGEHSWNRYCKRLKTSNPWRTICSIYTTYCTSRVTSSTRFLTVHTVLCKLMVGTS